MKRSWAAARAKVDDYDLNCCRVCGRYGAEAAHIIPRSRVTHGGEDPRNIVGLCRLDHQSYDLGTLDLLPHLSRDEQAYAVQLVGLEEARRYVTNERVA